MAEARIESLDRDQAEQARFKALSEGAAPAYQDRFMDPDEIAQSAAAEPEAEQPEGFRAWVVESRLGLGESRTTGYGRQRATEIGQRLEYRRETLNYGEFTLQAEGRHLSGDNFGNGLGMGGLSIGGLSIGGLGYARQATSERFTLRNLGFPLTTQTFADTAVGDLYSELTDGLARNYRLSLGSTTVRGASARIFRPDLDLRAGYGQRGLLTGGPYPGFEKNQGTLGWLGATVRLDGPWFAAFQLDQANDVPAYYSPRHYPGDDTQYDPGSALGLGSKRVTSWAASLGYGRGVLRDGDFRLRTTLLGSRTSAPLFSPAAGTAGTEGSSAQGLFIEASARAGAYRHEFGLHAAQPQLHFGDYALSSAARGAYWRVDRHVTRLSWGMGLDYERTPQTTAQDTGFQLSGYRRLGANGNAQYQFDRHTAVGGSFSAYQTRNDAGTAGGGQSRSLYGSAFYQTRFFDWPRSRFMLTVRRNELIVLGDSSATGQEVQWEQDWAGARQATLRSELTTTLGYARDRSGGMSRNYPTAGLQWRYWLESGLQLAGNLRYTSQSGSLYTSRGLSGSLSAEKELGRGWRMGFMAHFNQARSSLLPTPSSLPNLYRSDEKTAYVYLRWEGSAGTAYAAAGAPGEGVGGGSLSGRVFYDANRDGEQQAGEVGVAGVEVVLDGRYRTVTDRDGQFEFPVVPTGHHRLSLTQESVPLPWGASGDNTSSVHVPLRGQASASIAVVKVGE
ncbi:MULTISPECIES: SdrD B-like domain-containing protein [Delftia]|nr:MULTISPECIES: SdrD B-like domain-containing protein [Delftia]